MGNLMLSLLGTLSPKAYNLFLLVVLIFLAGYIALKEQKKRRGQESSAPQFPQKEKKEAPPLSRAAALGVIGVCLPLLGVGLVMLIVAAVLNRPLFIALGALLTGVSLVKLEKAGRDFRTAPRRETPPPPASGPKPQPQPADSGRLEQLKTLREAGLLTDEEYREERKKWMGEGKIK